MTDFQQRFIDAYVALRKGAPAVRRAGYAGDNAKQNAYELLQNEEIKAEIAKRFAAQTMTVEQATKDLTDIATTRLNDYMKVEKVLRTPMVRKPLQQLINELDAEMEFEEDFARIAKLASTELADHNAQQKQRELKGIRYTLELERYPNAYRDVPGESVWVDEARVDLVAIAKAKHKGRIKKLKIDGDGTTAIEMYAADVNLKTILEFHGKIIQRHANPDGSNLDLGFFALLKKASLTAPTPDDSSAQ